MAYAWIIDRDNIAEKGTKPGTSANAKGLIGPRGASGELVARLNAGEGKVFALVDDDSNHYYTGRIIYTADHAEGEEGFEPLDDFGAPNAGATAIKYKDASGAWKVL